MVEWFFNAVDYFDFLICLTTLAIGIIIHAVIIPVITYLLILKNEFSSNLI